jgi:hypothetical protein
MRGGCLVAFGEKALAQMVSVLLRVEFIIRICVWVVKLRLMPLDELGSTELLTLRTRWETCSWVACRHDGHLPQLETKRHALRTVWLPPRRSEASWNYSFPIIRMTARSPEAAERSTQAAAMSLQEHRITDLDDSGLSLPSDLTRHEHAGNRGSMYPSNRCTRTHRRDRINERVTELSRCAGGKQACDCANLRVLSSP